MPPSPPTPTRSPPTGIATAPEPKRLAHAARLLALSLLAAAGAFGARAADSPKTYIFQCEVNGKKVTSDRPIAECANKEQRQLNPDGSLHRIVKPIPTPDETEEMERKERERLAALANQNDAVRRDRNLMQRFPNEAAHKKARDKALDDLRAAGKNSEARIGVLMVERKKLEDEKQFYVNEQVSKRLPTLLEQKLDANEAALEAQKSLAQNQESEIARINRLYDAELARLRKLWAGAPAGSLGPLPGPQGSGTAGAPSPAVLKTSSQ
jgi:hypothetical protein